MRKVCEALDLTEDECATEIDEVRMMGNGQYLDDCGDSESVHDSSADCDGGGDAHKIACEAIVTKPSTGSVGTSTTACNANTEEAPLAQGAKDSDIDCATGKALKEVPPVTKDEFDNSNTGTSNWFDCCTDGISQTLALAQQAQKECTMAIECSSLRGLRTMENAPFCEEMLISLEELADAAKRMCDEAVLDLQELEPLRSEASKLEGDCEDQLQWDNAGLQGALHTACLAMKAARRAHLAQFEKARASSRLCREKTAPLFELASSTAVMCKSAMPPPRRRLHGCSQAYDGAMVLFEEDSEMAAEDFRERVEYCTDILPVVRRRELYECVQGIYLSDGRFLSDSDRWPRSEMHWYITLFSVVFSWLMGVVIFLCCKDRCPQDPLPEDFQRRRARREDGVYV